MSKVVGINQYPAFNYLWLNAPDTKAFIEVQGAALA